MFHFESKTQGGSLQSLPASDDSLEVAQIIRIRQVAVNEPTQLGGRFRSARRAIDVHPLAQLVASTSPIDSWALVRKSCGGKENMDEEDENLSEGAETQPDTHPLQSYLRDLRRSGRKVLLRTLHSGIFRWLSA